MKRLSILFLILCTFHIGIRAQEAFTTIRSKAQAALDNPQTDPLVKQISQFKVDALDYMVMKMKEVMPDSSATYLDKEALAMNDFISLYIQTILDSQKEPPAHQVKLIKLFMDASYSNPLFNDSDQELVLSYFSDGNSLTRFSLDTDWRLACIAVATELKKHK